MAELVMEEELEVLEVLEEVLVKAHLEVLVMLGVILQ